MGTCIGLDFDMAFRTATLRCAGVASVGVAPEARRTGAGSALMRGVHRAYREAGFSFAALYPFSQLWYSKFGYATCGNVQAIHCPVHELPRIADPLPMRELGPSDWRLLEPVYTAFARKYCGANFRKPSQWDRALGMDKPFMVYVAGDPIEAYVMVRLDGTFWNPLEIREVVWTSFRGYQSCLALFAALGMNKSKIVWDEPSDSPFIAAYLDSHVDIERTRSMMWRVLDVPAVLRAIEAEGDGHFTLRVLDPDLPENEGPWHIEFQGGSVEVRPASEASLTMTIQQFTQAAMGEPSLASLVRHGLLTSSDEASLATAIRFFGSQTVFCLDRY